MPTVPNNYAGWTVSNAQTDVEAAGLVLEIVPNARSTSGHVPTSSEESDTILQNADNSLRGSDKTNGAMVCVVLNAAR